MKKQRVLGIVILVTLLSMPVRAGWISDFGRRLTEGARNSVQNNLQNKLNQKINDAMDGKLKTDSAKGKKSYKMDPRRSESKSGSVPNSDNEYLDTRVTATSDRGKAIPYANKYEPINLGNTKFTGERIYDNKLPVGTRKVDIDEFLDPGYYLIWIDSESRTHAMSVVYEHESEGVGFGYGIISKKKIYNNGPRQMLGDKDGMMYIVEVLPNTQGHLELSMINSEQLMGSGTITIFKLPGPSLK